MSDIQLIDVANLNWPFSVLSSTNTPPGSPSIGDCYLAGSSPTGAWSGHANAIARFNDSSAWEFQTPSEGRTVWNVATDLWVTWNGSAWVNANPLPAGGTSGQVLAKTSSSDYAVGWVAAATSNPITIYFFLSVGSITNATGAIGDLAVVGGNPNGLYYKNTSNVWTLGGSITGSGGTITAVNAGTGLTGGGTSGSVTLATAYGTSSATACVGNDSRLSDDRTGTGLRTASTVVAVSSATAPSSGQVLTATSSTAATWQTPTGSSPTGSAGGDLGGTYPNPTVSTSAALKSATTNVVVSGATAPSSGQVLTATSTTAATWQTPSTTATPSGSASGDLGGAYPNPTVTQARGLKSATTTVDVASATAPTSGQVLTATGGSAATWQAPASGAPSGGASGDLGGSYPSPTVTQARGLVTATTTVAVSSATAPSSGQVLTATSSTAAIWQTPPGASSTTTVKKAGSSIGTRGSLNLIEGSNVTITATDNSGTDSVDVTFAASGTGGSGTRNPFIAAPTSAHSLDDEFDSGSADLATRGWTVVVYGTSTTMTRQGDIVLSGAPSITTNQYRSTIIGSMLYVQTNGQRMNVMKTIPNVNSQRSQHTVRARMPGSLVFGRSERGVVTHASGAPWFATGASFAVTYVDSPGVNSYRYYFAGTTNWTSTSYSVLTSVPTGVRWDVYWHHRKGGLATHALINSADGMIELIQDGTVGTAPSPQFSADFTTAGFVIGTLQTYSIPWVEISVIDYFRFTDATTETVSSVWFD